MPRRTPSHDGERLFLRRSSSRRHPGAAQPQPARGRGPQRNACSRPEGSPRYSRTRSDTIKFNEPVIHR
jgi:hypothetical protein